MGRARLVWSLLKDKVERLGLPKTHHVSRPADKVKLSEVVSKIFDFFDAVPPFYDKETPEALQIGGAWRAILLEKRRTQLAAIENKDTELYLTLLQHFYKSELIYGLWNYGRAPTPRLAPNFIREVRTFQVETGRAPRDLLAAGSISSAWGLKVLPETDSAVTYAAPAHGRQASHILNALAFLDTTSSGRQFTILDIGSGFGGMAIFLASWSTRPLRIVLLDIPLNLVNAYAFLKIAAPHLKVTLVSSVDDLLVETEDDVTAAGQHPSLLLVPTIYSETVAKFFPPDLIHNAQSFGEMDLETVDYYLRTFVRPDTRVIIETNASNFGATSLFGHAELGNEEIGAVLNDLGFGLIARHSRDSWARYAVSTFLRLS